MSSDFDVQGPSDLGLEAAGFRLENLETDRSIMYMLGPSLRIIYCNKAWDEFASLNGGIGLERNVILGTSILDVVPSPLRAFYEDAFAQVRQQLKPWEHDFECSSPDTFRLFHMRVLPLPNSNSIVENSLQVEKPHGPERPAMSADRTSYVNENGILAMCCHCRRTRRINAGAVSVWDWVPAFLTDPPGRVSHGLCRTCRAYYYPDAEIVRR